MSMESDRHPGPMPEYGQHLQGFHALSTLISGLAGKIRAERARHLSIISISFAILSCTPKPAEHATPAATPSKDKQEAMTASAPEPEILIDERWDRPPSESGFPDPYVFQHEGAYWIAGTFTDMGRGRIYRTRMLGGLDLTEFPLAFDLGEAAGAVQLWGFVPYRAADGSWHAYGTLNFTPGGISLEVAHFLPAAGETWTAERPIQHWRYDKTLAGDRRTGWNAYESKVIADEDGTLYLIHNETVDERIVVAARRMLDPGTMDPATQRRILLGPEGYRSEDLPDSPRLQLTEGTLIQKIQGKYVLLYSTGHCCIENGYKLGVAFSDRLIPPPGRQYEKITIPDEGKIWGEQDKGGREVYYLLQSQNEDWPNYIGDAVGGPGLGNLVQTGTDWFLIFHGRRGGQPFHYGEGRYVWKLPVRVNIDPSRPPEAWIVPLLPGQL
jgi:hypothetical protein